MNFVKCWYCGPPPLYPWVMTLVLLALGCFVWRSFRSPRPPDWWHKSRRDPPR